MNRKEIQETALALTGGFLCCLTDLTLFLLYFCPTSPSAKRYGALGIIEAVEDQLGNFSSRQILETIYRLRRKKLIASQDLKNPPLNRLSQIITAEGHHKLTQIIPTYRPKRTWNERVYLVTYDIPETQARDRDVLRDHLRTLGAGMLQASVWVILYDPRKILRDFMKEKGLEGTIVVSDIGSDGYIGEDQNLQVMLQRIYHLDNLNQRYQDFINQYEDEEGSATNNWLQAAGTYLTILRDDPQLPFEVLPTGWKGDQAHQLYQSILDYPK